MARKYIYFEDRDHRETVVFLDDIVILDHVDHEDKIYMKLKDSTVCAIECLSDDEDSDMIADDVFNNIMAFVEDTRSKLSYSSRYCIIHLNL